MDIDHVEENLEAGSSVRHRFLVPVDDDHPFDLESYISNYSGHTVVDRLTHIVFSCPSLAPEAFQLCVQYIHQSRDPSLYQTLLQAYDKVASCTDMSLPNPMDLAELDTKWADDVLTKNQADRVKLEVELKTYSNNMIKESIRMAHRDLAEFYRTTGDYGAALKHYTKSREFCTTSQHVLEMCMSILELLIEQRNYVNIMTYVYKAIAALDASAAAAANNTASNSTGAQASSSSIAKKRSTERENIQSKLDLAEALSYLGHGFYEKAADTFLKIGNVKELADWVGKIIAPGDIAVYGTLCALAKFSRSTTKAKILENSVFAAFIEQEPYIRELIESYMSSNFKKVLEILDRYSSRHYLDVHLLRHVNELMNAIRNRAVILYFQPFATIKLERMGNAFGWSLDEVEQHVVNLIQSGGIQGRVDSQNKILFAKKTDYRAELFAQTIKVGQDIQTTNRKLLLRLKLQQSDLVVKPPKGSAGAMMDIFT